MIFVSSAAGYIALAHNVAASSGDNGDTPHAPNNFGDNMTSGVAGPIAGIVILLLGIATYLLIRNMNKRLRRLPTEFHTESADTTDREPAEK